MRIVHVLHSMAVAGAEVLVHDFLNRPHAGPTQAVVPPGKMAPLGAGTGAPTAGQQGVCVIEVGARHRLTP